MISSLIAAPVAIHSCDSPAPVVEAVAGVLLSSFPVSINKSANHFISDLPALQTGFGCVLCRLNYSVRYGKAVHSPNGNWSKKPCLAKPKTPWKIPNGWALPCRWTPFALCRTSGKRHVLTHITMHLLNANTLQLQEFTDDERPKYAILSHRWQSEEVTFRNIQEDTGNKKKGFAKLRMACKRTLWDGLTHIWIDTCCIDKSSSAELSEAINSMFRWYAESDRCYVYLFDVSSLEPGMDNQVRETEFENSSWFTRSWTLQELIAPKVMIFYDRNWKEYGRREQLLLKIEKITGIPSHVYDADLDSFPIVDRMQWAAARTATRKEDIAYSLMGLFDVNMPMLYGEGGSKAFARLQEELIKKTTDRSLLLWNSRDKDDRDRHDVLAGSPKDFDIAVPPEYSHLLCMPDLEPFTLSSAGIELPVRLLRQGINEYVALLEEHGVRVKNYVLMLRLVPPLKTRPVFAKIRAREMSGDQLERWFSPCEARITLQRQLKLNVMPSCNGMMVKVPQSGAHLDETCHVRSVEIDGQRDRSDRYWIQPADCREWVCSVRVSVVLIYAPHKNISLRFKLGFDFWSRPVCLFWVHDSQHNQLDEILGKIPLLEVLGAEFTTVVTASTEETRYKGTSPYYVYRTASRLDVTMRCSATFDLGFAWYYSKVHSLEPGWTFDLMGSYTLPKIGYITQ